MKKKLSFIVSFIFLIVLSSGASAATFDKIVVFGDSLSDNGNIYAMTGNQYPPPAYGYFEGRYSNGKIWAEYLADALNLAAEFEDNALGGATTDATYDYNPTTGISIPGLPGLLGQVSAYGAASSETLYITWAGANDLLNMFAAAQETDNPTEYIEENYKLVIANAMTNIAKALQTLAGKGAKHILVPNIPSLGATPAFNGTLLPPETPEETIRATQEGAQKVTAAFNMTLKQTIATVLAALQQAGLTDVNMYYLDANAIIAEAVLTPEKFGITNYEDRARDVYLATGGTMPEGYLFWDDVHPTTSSHSIIADHALSVVFGLPEGINFIPQAGTLKSLSMISPDQYEGAGKPNSFTYDLFNFTIEGVTAGSQAVIDITLPEPAPQGAKWYKYDSESDTWVIMPSRVGSRDGVIINGDKVTLYITDGGEYDDDDVAGQITDPSGLATDNDPGSSGNSSMCFIGTLLGNW